MKNSEKDFVINFLNNWITAVCETFKESVFAWQKWASWIFLVKERWWESDDVFVMPNEDLIREVLEELDIPIFVRVKFWHFWEAKICEELWVDWIVEAFQAENSLKEKLNPEDFNFPIISEVLEPEKISESNENILILWDYATWDFNSIKEKFADCLEVAEKLPYSWSKNVFLWWWISSVADLEVLKDIWPNWLLIKWFFIWSAIFDLESEEFFEDYWDYKQNIFG